MNVSDMISTMRILGIGDVFDDTESKRIALIFLNLAHDELYRETSNLNDDVLVNETLTSVANETSITLSQQPFSVSNVFPVGFQGGDENGLFGKSVVNFSKYKLNSPIAGTPEIYKNSNKIISFYPIVSGGSYIFDVIYTPERTALYENTPESGIPYPLSYQGVLVDGALYYLFQDEAGFKNQSRENEALRRWEKGKADLKSYLYGSNKQLISTFSNA